jgi:uncharacterized repeat protein (TIGR03803 family)
MTLAGMVLALASLGVPLAQAQTYSVLYSFTGGTGGYEPQGSVVRDSAGNLYGTTRVGGDSTKCPDGCGVVFKVDPTGAETAIYSFMGAPDGADPQGLIRDSAGNLYGTAQSGGFVPTHGPFCAGGCGVIFKLDPAGKETILHRFSGKDGWSPSPGLIGDSAGNLYGATLKGGTADSGVVFKLDPTGTETVLYSFTGGADGRDPAAGLLRDSAGNLYGTTKYGGVCGNNCPQAQGCGVVFKVDPAGAETVLHSFTGSDGCVPVAGVVPDSAGNLYGTTFFGGTAGWGAIFTLDPAGTETTLYSFTEGAGGSNRKRL